MLSNVTYAPTDQMVADAVRAGRNPTLTTLQLIQPKRILATKVLEPALDKIFSKSTVGFTDAEKTAAFWAAIGSVALIGLAVVGVRAGIGHYVGKKLGSKWGWFYGGVFGTPGLGALALYNRKHR